MLERLWDSLVTTTMFMGMHAVVFIMAERIWPANGEQKRWRKGVVLDVFYSYFAVFLMTLVGVSRIRFAIDAMKNSEAIGGPLTKLHGFVGGLSFGVALVLAIVVADFAGYWKHRLMHTKLLWPFHAVHHSSEEIDFLSNERNHPVETVLANLLQLAPLMLLGFAPGVIGIAAAIRYSHSVYEHTNLRFSYGPLSYLFVSPSFHRWHHSADHDVIDKNYANVFSFWDWAFGTYHVPSDRSSPNAYGIPPFPKSFVGQVVQPFRDFASVLRGVERR